MMKQLKQLAARFLPQEPQRAQAGSDSELKLAAVLTPQTLANSLKLAEQGNLYEQQALFAIMEERDGHLFAELSKRKRAVLGLDWAIVPPDDATDGERKQAAELQHMVRSIANFDDALFDLTDAIGKGYSCLSIKWGVVNGQNVPTALTHVRQTAFSCKPDTPDVLRLRNDYNPDGDALIDYGWVRHKQQAKSGTLATSALFRTLAWAYIYKHYSIRDLAAFLETYGMPIRIGKWQPGASQADKRTLVRALQTMGSNAWGGMPNTMDVEFVESGKGKSDEFLGSIQYYDAVISKAILGGTLTSQADGKTSTNALGNIHNEVRRDLLEGDAKQLAETLTRYLIEPLQLFNGLGKPGRMCRFAFALTEQIDQQAAVEVLTKATALGMQVPLNWAHKHLQIPQAGKDDEMLRLQTATHQQPQAATRTSVAALHDSQPDGVESLISRLVNYGFADDAIGRVQVAIAVGDWAMVTDTLDALARELPADEVVDVLAHASAISDLAGRAGLAND